MTKESQDRNLSTWVSGLFARTATTALAAGRIPWISALMFALTMNALHGGAQTLHNFSGGTDGAFPVGGLARGPNGVLYGTTQYGGSSSVCPNGYSGTVFQMTPPQSPGNPWTESVIYAFTPSDGCFAYPLASPIVGPGGNLFGTNYFGGPESVGDVYELSPPSSPGGKWTETTLYSFSGAVGAPQNPESGLVIDKNGVLYGTVQFAGTSPSCPFGAVSYGCGAVYSLTPPSSPGAAWTEQTLYTFQGGDDGAVPLADLSIGNDGKLFGTTYAGGPSLLCTAHNLPLSGFGPQSPGCGTVFELDPPSSPGGSWTETEIYSFSGGRDGGFPNAVTYHDGELFGTVSFGGDPKNCGGVGCGGVYRLSPPVAPGDSWTERMIYSFTSHRDGLFPGAGVVIGKDGVLYGTTRDGGDRSSCPEEPGCGVVFELSQSQYSDREWSEQVLHRFALTDGWRPISGLVIGEEGDLYGTTVMGGSSTNCLGGCGVVFEVQTQGSRRDQ